MNASTLLPSQTVRTKDKPPALHALLGYFHSPSNLPSPLRCTPLVTAQGPEAAQHPVRKQQVLLTTCRAERRREAQGLAKRCRYVTPIMSAFQDALVALLLKSRHEPAVAQVQSLAWKRPHATGAAPPKKGQCILIPFSY